MSNLFGVIVSEKNPASIEVPDEADLIITRAALSGTQAGATVLSIQADEIPQPLVFGTLRSPACEQFELDCNVAAGSILVFSVQGPNEVHLTGYFNVRGGMEWDEDDSSFDGSDLEGLLDEDESEGSSDQEMGEESEPTAAKTFPTEFYFGAKKGDDKKKLEVPKEEKKPVAAKKPEAQKPEAKKPVEAKKPEAKSPEAKKPAEAKKPEAKTPEAKKPAEKKTPEAKKPEAKTPEAKKPEAKTPEAKKPEAKTPEAKKPAEKKPEEAKTPEAKGTKRPAPATPEESAPAAKKQKTAVASPGKPHACTACGKAFATEVGRDTHVKAMHK